MSSNTNISTEKLEEKAKKKAAALRKNIKRRKEASKINNSQTNTVSKEL